MCKTGQVFDRDIHCFSQLVIISAKEGDLKLRCPSGISLTFALKPYILLCHLPQ